MSSNQWVQWAVTQVTGSIEKLKSDLGNVSFFMLVIAVCQVVQTCQGCSCSPEPAKAVATDGGVDATR